MSAITRERLMSLEQYAKVRPSFRARVLAHKKNRYIRLGEHVTVCFADELTIHYQIQEMLRVERIFEEEGIRAELDAYSPLVPDGTNLKATMLIEYVDPAERARRLAELIGIAERVWLQVGQHDRVYAIADEDLARDNASKTASVHFLRFEFDPPMIAALKTGAPLAGGIDHARYTAHVAVDPETAAALAADFAD